MAHVMTYPEIIEASKNHSIIYEELKGRSRVRPLKFNGVDFAGTEDDCYLLLIECDEDECADYNWHYRCWNEMPSDELRANTAWKENPYKAFMGNES